MLVDIGCIQPLHKIPPPHINVSSTSIWDIWFIVIHSTAPIRSLTHWPSNKDESTLIVVNCFGPLDLL